MFSTKYFFSQTKKSSHLFKIFPPFTSNGMILCYRKSYFNSVLNQFQMTEKRKHQCKESGHLAVRTLEYTPLLSHISTLDLCEVTPLIYLPSFYHSLVYLITENFGINTLALKFWRKKEKWHIIESIPRNSDLQALPWTLLLGYKIFHVYLQLTSLLLLCSWH